MSSVRQWLESVALGHCADLFEQSRIDFDILPELTEQDLEKLGLALGDRKRLFKAIAERDAAGAATEDHASSAAGAPTLERRQVTVLFVDLTGYTRLTSTLGAEVTHKLVRRFYDRVTELVRAHSGTVERHIGDAIMAVFGLPVAHSNDPERALRCALAIHEAMPHVSRDVGHPLSVHAGIASGPVIAERTGPSGEFSVVGDAVNLAARLVSLAQSSETIVSGAVHRAVAALVESVPIGEVDVKGFDRPISAWRVRGVREAGGVPQRPPLIGRKLELAQFRTLCEICREATTGQLVVVRGEAGIGKTRLVEAFETAAAEAGFASHKGLALDFGISRARTAVARIVASILRCSDTEDPEIRTQALTGALAEGLVTDEETIFAGDLLGLPLPDSLRPVYNALDNTTRVQRRRRFVVQLLQRTSERQPRLVVVEDVHWADASLLEMLAEIVAGIEHHRLVLVVTTRPEADPLTPAWRSRIGSRTNMLTLDLRPLRDTEASELARAFGLNDEAAIQALVQRADGNALFLEQLLHATVGEQESVPGSIQSLVLSRLDRLRAADRRAIQAASVLGQCFSLPVLRNLIDDPDYACEALLAENLVRPIGDELLFAHALVWESTYLSLLSDQKREWHIAAAAWHASSDPAIAAGHLERAQDPRAARAYLEAARAENKLHHTERTVELLERGLQLATEPADRVELLMELGALLPTIGRPREAIDLFAEVLDLAIDDRQRCNAKIGIAAGLRMVDMHREALAALDEAERLAGSEGFEAERAQIHNLRGNVLFPLGDVEGTLAEQTRALELARVSGSVELHLRALSGLGDAHYAAGRFISAYEHFNECVAMSRNYQFSQVEAANLPMLAFCANLNGRPKEGLAAAEQALATARRVGNRRAQIIAHHAHAVAHLEANDVAHARPHAEASVNISRAIGARRFEPESMGLVAHCLWMEGKRAEATVMMREAWAMVATHMIQYCGPMILGALARSTHDPAERMECLKKGEQILAGGSPAHNHVFFFRDAIDCALEDGDWAAAMRYADRLDEAFRHEPILFVDYTSARARALAAFGQGRRDGALRSQLQRLIDLARDAGLIASAQAVENALSAPDWRSEQPAA